MDTAREETAGETSNRAAWGTSSASEEAALGKTEPQVTWLSHLPFSANPGAASAVTGIQGSTGVVESL